MFRLCYSSLKGGVGKSSSTILTAKYIAQVKGEKVLIVDLDFQNSTSFHFVPEYDERNVANALFNNDIKGNIIPVSDTISILQSSLKLTKMQTLHTSSLKNLLAQIDDEYAWCIIDTKPDYNNIVLNGILAADLIITPVVLECFFDLKTALFLKEQLSIEEPELLPKWKLLFTRVRKVLSENSIILEYLNSYKRYFNNIMSTQVPDTKLIGRLIDSDSVLTRTKTNEKVFELLDNLYAEIAAFRGQEVLQ